jgi:hypothetical protein
MTHHETISGEIPVIDVLSPLLLRHASLRQGANELFRSERYRRSKVEQRILESEILCDVSYCEDALRCHFRELTLNVFAKDEVVDWNISGPQCRINTPCANPVRFRVKNKGGRTFLFDRQSVLAPLIGKRIRHAPSLTGLFLQWGWDLEIGVSAWPLANGQGWILQYG